jgi:hypothetical protein
MILAKCLGAKQANPPEMESEVGQMETVAFREYFFGFRRLLVSALLFRRPVGAKLRVGRFAIKKSAVGSRQ